MEIILALSFHALSFQDHMFNQGCDFESLQVRIKRGVMAVKRTPENIFCRAQIPPHVWLFTALLWCYLCLIHDGFCVTVTAEGIWGIASAWASYLCFRHGRTHYFHYTHIHTNTHVFTYITHMDFIPYNYICTYALLRMHSNRERGGVIDKGGDS